MKEYESFNVENKNKNEHNNINRYEVNNAELKESFILQKKIRNKKRFPLLFFIFIFSLILLLGFLIAYLVLYIIKDEKYEEFKDPYLKPFISHHSYTKYIFDNGLELLLIQVDENDLAWGTIAFDSGYLDTRYDPGILKLAIKSLINEEIEKANELKDYNGDFQYSVDEFYSTISFQIMNSGFSKYLKIFSKLTYLNKEKEKMIKNNIENNKIIIQKDAEGEQNDLSKRENHLIEYLIYGYTKDGNEILPQSIDESQEVKNETIINVIKSLLNPSKVKIVLASHFKVSLMRKLFLNYFKEIIDSNSKENEIENAYNISDFTKQKMLYLKIRDYETNYMKINYYLERRNENNFTTIYIESGYLNYIKYILDETNEGSLHYRLRKNYKIIDLSCDFKVILKNKIKFTIYIGLSSYSFNNITDIRKEVYQFMNELKIYINKLEQEDKRGADLYHIIRQNFTFSEDIHGDFSENKEKAINLFIKNSGIYYLRKLWVPGNFTRNINDMKQYINQLNPENSVVLICLNDEALKNYYDESAFWPIKFNKTKYFNLNYSIINLDIDFQENINNENYNFSNYSNEYISRFTEDSKIECDPRDRDNYFTTKHTKLTNKNGSLTEFYYMRDTSFKLPKVYITLNFFHPFQRSNDNSTKDYNFFEIVLYMAFLKRELNFRLADAIRAGNSFKIYFNQNLFYVDVFAYFDVVKNLLNEVKKIIFDRDFFNKEGGFSKNFEIYKEIALNDFLNINSTTTFKNLRLAFYQYLTEDKEKNYPPIYNYFSFPRKKFINLSEEEKEKINNDMNIINCFLIQGYLYGYIDEANNTKNETNADSLYEIFAKEEINCFADALVSANLGNSNLNYTNYIEWVKKKNKLNESKVENRQGLEKNTLHRFMYFSEYTLKNYLISLIFQKILAETTNLNLNYFTQGEIYDYFTIKSNDIDNIINNANYLRDTIKDILNKKKDLYLNDIDAVGNRFYYLVVNQVYTIFSKSEDMKGSAISVSNSNFYKGESFGELFKYKEMEYEEFIDEIETFFCETNYVDFKPI